jgi:dimeric dUTPase (all-alpha-NTP-PPase superfamily)
LNVEPAAGSTPPSAGVTPAPGIKKKCGTSSLLEVVRADAVAAQVRFGIQEAETQSSDYWELRNHGE